jgi:flagellin
VAPSGNTGKFGPGVAYAVEGKEYGPEAPVILQIGAEKAIDAFDGAVQYVNRERSRMGAYQNRLEHTIKNLDNIVENTQQAESRIRDTDMAKLIEYANTQIIAQAGQSMLTQANQSSQSVLHKV